VVAGQEWVAGLRCVPTGPAEGKARDVYQTGTCSRSALCPYRPCGRQGKGRLSDRNGQQVCTLSLPALRKARQGTSIRQERAAGLHSVPTGPVAQPVNLSWGPSSRGLKLHVVDR
jgi:hypothetical protein